ALETASAIDIDWNAARLLLPVSDLRGIHQVAAEKLPMVVGELHPVSEMGLTALAAQLRPVSPESQSDLDFSISLVIGGSRGFSVLPSGARTTLQLESTWPDPSFSDTFLPAVTHLRGDGFDAAWTVLEVNRTFGQSGTFDASLQQAFAQ